MDGLLRFSLLSVLVTGIVEATPTTSTSPRVTPPAECKAHCTFQPPFSQKYGWVKKRYSSTMLAADLVYLVDPSSNKTVSTSTKTYDLPKGHRTDHHNSDGTLVHTWTPYSETISGTVVPHVAVLTYPTSTAQYYNWYEWYGVLPTTDSAGVEVCSTAREGQVTAFPSHPPHPEYYPAKTVYDYPEDFPREGTRDGKDFAFGKINNGGAFYDKFFPNETAIQSCEWNYMNWVVPQGYLTTVSWLTRHTTSYIQTSKINIPTKTQTKPTSGTTRPSQNGPPANTIGSPSSAMTGVSPSKPTRTSKSGAGGGSGQSPESSSGMSVGIPLDHTTIPAVVTPVATVVNGQSTKVSAVVVDVSGSLATILPGVATKVRGTPVHFVPQVVSTSVNGEEVSTIVSDQYSQPMIAVGTRTFELSALSIPAASSPPVSTNEAGSIVIGTGASAQTMSMGESITLGTGSQTTMISATTDSSGRTIVIGNDLTLSPVPASSVPPVSINQAESIIVGEGTTAGTMGVGQSITLGEGTKAIVVSATTNAGGDTVVVGENWSTTLDFGPPSLASGTTASAQSLETSRITQPARTEDVNDSDQTGNPPWLAQPTKTPGIGSSLIHEDGIWLRLWTAFGACILGAALVR